MINLDFVANRPKTISNDGSTHAQTDEHHHEDEQAETERTEKGHEHDQIHGQERAQITSRMSHRVGEQQQATIELAETKKLQRAEEAAEAQQIDQRVLNVDGRLDVDVDKAVGLSEKITDVSDLLMSEAANRLQLHELAVPSEDNDVVEVPILFAIVRQNGDTELQEENAVHPVTRLSVGSPSRDLSCPCSAHRSPAEDR